MTIRKVIAQVKGLRYESKSKSIPAQEYQDQAWALRKEALDELYLRGLSGTTIYSDIERVRFPRVLRTDLPREREIVREYCAPGLEVIKDRLELALRGERRSRRRSQGTTFRQPSPGADSKVRARTVGKLRQELRTLTPALSSGQEYEHLKEQFPHFLTFRIVESRPKLKTELTEVTCYRGLLKLAQELAAHYHEKEVSTIQTDWKHHKPPKFRRRR